MSWFIVFWYYLFLIIFRKNIRYLYNHSYISNLVMIYYNKLKIDNGHNHFISFYLSLFLVGLIIMSNYQYILVIMISILILFTYFNPLIKAKKLYDMKIKKLKFEFPIWIRQIQVLLKTNTVNTAIDQSIRYCPSLILDDVKELSKALKERPNDAKTYISFLKEYPINEVFIGMRLLYSYNIIGDINSNQQLDNLIKMTSKWLTISRNERYEANLMIFSWLAIVPLLILTMIFLVLIINYMMMILKGGI
ncbi:MAG: hypothetical protein WBO70_00940 [Erysipelotrichaceae bacterium]